MQNSSDKVVVLLTKGIDSEFSSVAFTIANGALTAGMTASVFLTSAAIDQVRKGGQKMTQLAPLESLAELIEDFQARGGAIWACPPTSSLAATSRPTCWTASSSSAPARCSPR